MRLEDIEKIIETARAEGKQPDLSTVDFSNRDVSSLDLSDAILQGGSHLGGIWRGGTRPIPGQDPPRAKYNSKTKFPEGFDRHGEMEKTD